MSDALSPPSRPNLDQYKKLAKGFQDACQTGDMSAVLDWAKRWLETLGRLQGRDRSADPQEMRADLHRIQQRFRKMNKLNEDITRCTLADAQFLLAQCHGFDSWAKFAGHIGALAREDSAASLFERAADAIVAGDIETLDGLLGAHPELAAQRSEREHGSPLLHYVSANGVEDFRQTSPKNIVAIARRLLDAGADVNAESNAYGGRSAVLGLTSTSWPPQEAGVQIELMELLIERGAAIDGPSGGALTACLHNGRKEAAEYLARRGARLDLEGAAGVGDVQAVRGFFEPDGSLKAGSTRKQMTDGFIWACEFGRDEAVGCLLDLGMPIDERGASKASGLHWAAYEGNASTVELLLQRGADVDARDGGFEGTALDWGIYGWGNVSEEKRARRRYYEAVAALAQKGAKMTDGWYENDDERVRAMGRVGSDLRMQAALRGEVEGAGPGN